MILGMMIAQSVDACSEREQEQSACGRLGKRTSVGSFGKLTFRRENENFYDIFYS